MPPRAKQNMPSVFEHLNKSSHSSDDPAGVAGRDRAVVVGFSFGAEPLGGMLAGVTVTGVLLAIFMANSGGAWDNAKKAFEEGCRDQRTGLLQRL